MRRYALASYAGDGRWVRNRCAVIELLALVVYISIFPVGCQNSLQSIQKEQETRLAVMQEKEKSILAECELKRLGGELKTYAESTQCSNPVIIQAHQEAGDPAMNLVYLLTAYRLAIAERIDKGALSEAEGNLMLAQLVSRINTERLQRDMAAAQQTARVSQSYEALLQGLGVWQSPVNPPAENNIGSASSTGIVTTALISKLIEVPSGVIQAVLGSLASDMSNRYRMISRLISSAADRNLSRSRKPLNSLQKEVMRGE